VTVDGFSAARAGRGAGRLCRERGLEVAYDARRAARAGAGRCRRRGARCRGERAALACSAPGRANLIGNPSDQYGGTTSPVVRCAPWRFAPRKGRRFEGGSCASRRRRISRLRRLFDVARAVLAAGGALLADRLP
jgi:hypothetical protein